MAPVFIIRLRGADDVRDIHALRHILKALLRRHHLVCVGITMGGTHATGIATAAQGDGRSRSRQVNARHPKVSGQGVHRRRQGRKTA